MKLRLLIIGIFVVFVHTSLSYAGDNKVPYPEGYRNWTHVKSMIIEAGHSLENPFQGIHHVYANHKAVKGLKNNKYSDDSVLVFDLLNTLRKDSTIQESERKLVGVMYKDAKKYKKTGGWGFEGFASNSKTERLTKDGGVSCFGCHAPIPESDYVYSQYRK
jgi:hypothetical protein